jgi:membrane protease YdiL (CAAX protease family)
MKIWGYWATLGWAILAFLAGQFIGSVALLSQRSGAWNSLLDTPYDGILVTVFIAISNPVTIAVIMFAVWLAHTSQVDYLALKRPQTRDVIIGLVGLVILIAVSDSLLYVSGRDLVTQFQLQSYTTAATEGWLLPMLLGAIVIAPAGEEIMFRGFLFRGWARALPVGRLAAVFDESTAKPDPIAPARSAWIAIVVISVLWAILHVQYDWTGIAQIFAIGLFLGFIRWRSGSTLLTFFLHALFNLEATIETVAQIHFFAK